MAMGPQRSQELTERFAVAVADLDRRLASAPQRFVDDNQAAEARAWLDGNGPPLPWAGPSVTADEWFFVTTLYGEMTLEGQRTHIRAFFLRFVHEAQRDVRAFTPDLVADWKLRSGWMKGRLCRMGEILRE